MNKKLLFCLLPITLLACNAVSSLFVTAPDCTQLDLTSEECANAGLHTYTYTGTIHTTVDKCSWVENHQTVKTSEAELDIEFTKESVKICWKIEEGTCVDYSKTGTNSYMGQYSDENVTYPILLTFNSEGMNEEQQSPNCPATLDYIRSK